MPDVAYSLPPIELLTAGNSANDGNHFNQRIATRIGSVFRHFDVNATVTGFTRGPAVTRYKVALGHHEEVEKLAALWKYFAWAAATQSLRIHTPSSGNSTIGIEVPNTDREIVRLFDLLAVPAIHGDPNPLRIGLGKDREGGVISVDLAETPHLLVASSAGLGKSRFVKSMLISVLSRATPTDLRLILIDPMMRELTDYEGIPHLITPIITQPKKAVTALTWLVADVEKRRRDMQAMGVHHIDDFNSVARTPYPHIVVVIAEFADLMQTAPRDTEGAIVRLTQSARAVGIHLVLATQWPSVDVVTGPIKSAVPSRLVFTTFSMTDSQLVLDQPGAEKLTGMGDALFLPMGAAEPIRFQGAYVADEEITAVVAAAKAQAEPDYITGVTYQPPQFTAIDPEIGDDIDLLLEAVQLVVTSGSGSTAMLQRRLRVGFAKAGRLMELMEVRDIVGQSEGSRARSVLVSSESLPALLDSLKR